MCFAYNIYIIAIFTANYVIIRTYISLRGTCFLYDDISDIDDIIGASCRVRTLTQSELNALIKRKKVTVLCNNLHSSWDQSKNTFRGDFSISAFQGVSMVINFSCCPTEITG